MSVINLYHVHQTQTASTSLEVLLAHVLPDILSIPANSVWIKTNAVLACTIVIATLHASTQSVSSLARVILAFEAVVHNAVTSLSVMKAKFAMTAPCAQTPLVRFNVSVMLATKGTDLSALT